MLRRTVLLVAAAAGVAALYVFLPQIRNATRDSRDDSHGSELATLAKFQQLHVGMTRAQVRAIVGSDGTMEGNASRAGDNGDVMYGWDGQGEIGARMGVIFRDGRLAEKFEFGLR